MLFLFWVGIPGQDWYIVMLLVIHCHLVVSRAGRRLTLIAGTLWEYVVYFIFHHQLWTSQFLASSTITPLSLNSRFCPLSLVYSKNAKNKTWLQKDLRKQKNLTLLAYPWPPKFKWRHFNLVGCMLILFQGFWWLYREGGSLQQLRSHISQKHYSESRF